MEFPLKEDEYSIFPAEEFESAAARSPGELGAELMVQTRDNGRIQDHFKVVIGGGAPLELETSLTKLFYTGNDRMAALRAQFQFWPRDLSIRRNAVTSTWTDTYTFLAKKNAMLVDDQGAGVPVADMAKVVEGIEDAAEKSSSFRWAVVIGDDNKLRLDLQALPATEKYIAGRPALKR